MAADQERADRIRLLKRDNPQLKWRHIADHVGVELRSAQMWQETGAISYENAKKLAELVGDPAHDVDWIMRGPRESERAPSPFAGQDALADRLDQMEALIAKQNELLARQSQILKRIEEKLGQDTETADRMETVSETLGGAAAQLDAHLKQIVSAPILRSGPRRKRAAKRTIGPKGTPRA